MVETIGYLQLTLDPISLILSQFSDPLNSNNTFRLITDSYFMERGFRYNAYAQLRESKLQSKRLKLVEIEPLSEIPTSNYSPPVKKSVKFHASLGKFEENDQVSAIPRLEPLKKSVKFHGISSNCEKIEQVCEVPKLEHSSPVNKSVKFHGNSCKFQENVRNSAIPRPDFLRKSVNIHEISSKCEEINEVSPPVKKSMKFQGIKQGNSTLKKENRKPTPENNNVERISRTEKCTTPPTSMTKREKMYDDSMKNAGRSKSVNSLEKQRMMIGRKSYASIEELKGLSIAASNAINGEIKGGRRCNVLRKSTVFSSKYY